MLRAKSSSWIAFVLATTFPILNCAAVMAATVKLKPAGYSYEVLLANGIGPDEKKNSQKAFGDVVPVPLADLVISGSISGNYHLIISNKDDEIQGQIAVHSTTSGLGETIIDYLASTSYQVVAVPKLGKHPPSALKIPFVIAGSGTTFCSASSGSAVASISKLTIFYDEDILLPFGSTKCGTEDRISDPPFNKKVTFFSTEELPISVALSVGTYLYVEGGAEVAFDAFVDPTIEIDPSFAYADDFELEYSPGFDASGPSMSAPEPGTLLLLAIGAPLTLLLRRRGRWGMAGLSS